MIYMVVMDRVNNYLNNHGKQDNYYTLAIFIRNHIESIPCYSTTELAKYSYTSQATVSRFTKRLGYANYVEFKDAINEYLHDTKYFDDRRILSLPLSTEIFKILNYDLNWNEIRRIGRIIREYQNVFITGLNFSYIMAEYFQMSCHVFRKNIDTIMVDSDFHDLGEHDLLIVLTGYGNYFIKERGSSSKIKKCKASKMIISIEKIDKKIEQIFDYIFNFNMKIGDKNNHYVMMAIIDLICDELRKST